MKKKLSVKIGYSDHTLGTLASVIATSYGAKVIEKHFTLDKKFSNFRDHEISADKNEMKKLVVDVNRAYSMLGKFNKEISKSEKKNKNLMRRSIYAKKDLNKNYRVSIDDIKITRPFVKTEPQDVNKILNKKLKKNVYKNEELKV